jgi:hypothetical protein
VPSHPVSPHLLLPGLPEEEKFNVEKKTVTLCMHMELEENRKFQTTIPGCGTHKFPQCFYNIHHS